MRRPILALVAILAVSVTLPARGIDWDKIVINGYTSFEYERQFEAEDEGGGDPNGSFDSDGFDLVFNFQVSDKLRVSTDLTWEHGPATEDDRGNIAIEYGFIEYTVSDMMKVRVGKMFTPFGIYNQIHTAKPTFLSVKEPASTNKPERIVEDAARFFPRWGAGIALQGDGTIGDKAWDYDVLLANGEQDETNPFEEDNNKSKSVTGRFRLEPTDNLRVGASFYYDKLDAEDYDTIHSEGLELEWTRDKLHVQAEAVFGNYSGVGVTPDKTQLGLFILPSYHFDNGVTPYLRIDWIDPDTDRSSDEGTDLVLGVNYELSKWFMIKTELNHFNGSSNSTLAEYPGRDYNELKAAVVLGF